MDVNAQMSDGEQELHCCIDVPRISGCMDARQFRVDVFKTPIQMFDLKRMKRAAALEEAAMLDQASLAENPCHIVVPVVQLQIFDHIAVAVSPAVVGVE